MTRAPELYQRLGDRYRRASITVYKRNLKDSLFHPTGYTFSGGRIEYWFNAKDEAKAIEALDALWRKR